MPPRVSTAMHRSPCQSSFDEVISSPAGGGAGSQPNATYFAALSKVGQVVLPVYSCLRPSLPHGRGSEKSADPSNTYRAATVRERWSELTAWRNRVLQVASPT